MAVVIGIDTYGEGISPLRSAVADAAAIAEALRRDHGFETWCLFEEDARLPGLLALLRERLPAAFGPEDRLLFYFAGHGIALDSDRGPAGYLVPAGAGRADPEGFLRMHELHGALSSLPVRHALVILDCCFAGAFRWSSLRDVEPTVATIYRERYDRYVERAAWQVLTSASGTQLAFDLLGNDRGDSAERHSPFARALLEGLAGGADYTRDNLITADELAIFVRERVAPAAESAGRRQIPQLFQLDRHDDGQFVFQVPSRAVQLMSAPPLDEDANPYRGLHSFREQDCGLFFGRDAAAKRLIEAVTAQRLTVVVGPSGTGKSSLVQAGLVPALRAHGWTVLPPQRPGREPLAALAALAHALGPGAAAIDPVAAWGAALAEREGARPGQPWLVVVDQLEELVTHRGPEHERVAFLGALASALEAAPGLRVVVTVRSDIEPQLHDSALGRWWTGARFVVPGVSRDELREIIQKPARAAVLHFEPSHLVERLIDDVALVPAPLPLLSFALSELYRRCWSRWQAGARDRALREADYDEMGSVARALTRRATALYDALVAEHPAYAITIRNVLVRMVAVVGGERARRRVLLDELDYADPAENRRVAEVLQRFHEARLISLGTEKAEGGETARYAEPIHDELVRGWAQVSRWLDELDSPAGTRALLGAVGSAARAWQVGKRASSLLWTDPRVELADRLARDRPFMLNAREAWFVWRSAHLRRARRRRLLGGLLAVIGVLAVAAAIALWQRKQATAEKDASQRLLARSYQETGRQLLLDGRPLEAMPYLVEARRAGAAGAALQMLFGAAARHLPVLIKHQQGLHGAALSPDGARVVTYGFGSAQVWDATTGKPVSPPLEHPGGVRSTAFSLDATRVVTAGPGVRVWDVTTGKLVAPPLDYHRGSVISAVSPDGTRVVLATSDKAARVWGVTGKPVAPRLPHQDLVDRAMFSPDGTRVVTITDANSVRVWDATTGAPISPPLPHQVHVDAAALDPGGTRVVIASTDQPVQVWDAATGKPVSPPLSHQGHVGSAVFSPDGARVLTASWDKTARVWDATTGKPLTPPLAHPSKVWRAAFTPDGARIVTESEDRTARLWDAATGEPLAWLPAGSTAAFSSDGRRMLTMGPWEVHVWEVVNARPQPPVWESVSSAAFSPDGLRLVTTSEKSARVWDATTGKPLTPPLEHRGIATSAAFSPDGLRVVTTSEDKTARIWSAITGAPSIPPLEHRRIVRSAAFSQDGSLVATVVETNELSIWDATTGKQRFVAVGYSGTVTSAAFNRNGTSAIARIINERDEAIWEVWRVRSGSRRWGFLGGQELVTSAAFGADSKLVITADLNGTASIKNVADHDASFPSLRHQDAVLSAAFSPDGTRVATAGADRIAKVWAPATGKPIAPPLQHPGPVVCVAFSPDSERVVTASGKTAWVWDAVTGALLAAPIEHQDLVQSVAFSPDGERVVTTTRDKTVRVWLFPLDRGTLADWAATAKRGPYVLVNGVLSR